jgi:hypothetical protein
LRPYVRKNLREAPESLRDNVDEDDNDKLEHDSLKGVELRMLQISFLVWTYVKPYTW